MKKNQLNKMKWIIYKMKWDKYLKRAFYIPYIKKKYNNSLYVKRMPTRKVRKISRIKIRQYKNNLKTQKIR